MHRGWMALVLLSRRCPPALRRIVITSLPVNPSSTRRATPPSSYSDACTTSTARMTNLSNQRRTNERTNEPWDGMEQNIVIFPLLQHTPGHIISRLSSSSAPPPLVGSASLPLFSPLSLSSRYRLLVSKSNPKPKNRIQSTLTLRLPLPLFASFLFLLLSDIYPRYTPHSLPHSLSIYPSCFAICQLSTNQTTILSLSYFHVSFPFGFRAQLAITTTGPRLPFFPSRIHP
ncbi:hypothetical protein DFH08DRAFT_833237 [Mycena albidolilacea]|uniref:Uncharacterized protein n=1 Tax=Mycena albidolilacea TaxID=1033008 RepID=A0AAD7F740_9AGAR|nr:hypothetical protein DFH08DRAFT_833237 [Mycena albidolilacea]